MSTPPTAVLIAALRAHNQILVRDNERLARENEELRGATTRTSPTPAQQSQARPTTPGPAVKDWPVAASSATDSSPDFAGIRSESVANAGVKPLGSLAGGELRSVGFASAEGYVQAVRRGVTARTHAEYLRVLRTQFGKTEQELASLPGPLATGALPEGPGIAHVPTGVPLFDRPRSERRFLVGAQARSKSPPIPPISQPQAQEAAPTSTGPRPKAPSPKAPLARLTAGTVPVRRLPPAPPSSNNSPDQAPAALPKAAGTTTPGPRPPSDTTARDRPGDDASARFALLELD